MSGFYVAGEGIQAVVADIGSYATKMGFAGDDYPKAYFRSNVAVKRRDAPEKDDAMDVDDDDDEPATNESADKRTKQRRRRRPIDKVHYDFFTRPIEHKAGNDGDWTTANPIDSTTGLLLGDDWYELAQEFWKRGYDKSLLCEPRNHPFLLVERSYNPPPIRQELLEILMESMDVPAAFFGRDATLACYACGKTTGTVVDIGYNSTVVTPVYEGYVEQKTIKISPMGSKQMDLQLTEQLDQLLGNKQPFLPLYQVRKFAKRRDDFHLLARLDVARQCREEGSGAAIASSQEAKFQSPSMSFALPDGTEVDVPARVRFATSDLLLGTEDASIQRREQVTSKQQKELNDFLKTIQEDDDNDEDDEVEEYYRNVYSEASAVGLSQRRRKDEPKPKRPGSFSNRHLQKACASYLKDIEFASSPIPAMICDAAFQSDRDQQASLLGNVVVAGGGARLGPTDQALPDFLREHVEKIIHQHTPGWRVKVSSPNFPERAVCSWLGGSILGSLGTFHEMWITKKEYEEWGSAIVNRKCP